MVCKTCLGTGRIISKCDADEGKYWNLQPCPDCIENNTCPKCDSEIFYDEDTEILKCWNCGYNDETGELDNLTKEIKENKEEEII